MPAMQHMGRVVLADIGVEADHLWFEIAPPDLPPLDPQGHKYSRGLVHCLAGTMPGATPSRGSKRVLARSRAVSALSAAMTAPTAPLKRADRRAEMIQKRREERLVSGRVRKKAMDGAKALLGPKFKITESRGTVLEPLYPDRPILAAVDRKAAAQAILDEISQA